MTTDPPIPAAERELALQLDDVIADNINGGYGDLMPFSAVRELLNQPSSALRRLFSEVFRSRPDMDLLNLLSTVAGAVNLAAAASFGPAAADAIESAAGLDALIDKQWSIVSKLALTRNNNPTIPQRAISFACHMNRSSGRHGVLELGCSRGDIGRVLLSTCEMLRDSERWFLPSWQGTIPSAALERAVEVDSYLGIDLNVEVDDEWLLALWGLRDARRSRLAEFYREFPPTESQKFRRIQADLCQLEEYVDGVRRWLEGVDSLTVISSFVLYQLTPMQRRQAVRNVAAIRQMFFDLRGPNASFEWLNQGLPAERTLEGCIKFSNLALTRLEFRVRDLEVRQLACLNNDACEGWRSCDDPPVRFGKILP